MKKFLLLFLLMGSTEAWGAHALQKGMDLAYNAQFDQAKAVLNAYIAGNPGDPLGYIVRGTAYDWEQLVTGKKRDNEALADYQTANKYAFLLWEKDEENVDKMVTLGNSYMFLAKKWLDLNKKSRAGLILKKCQKHMEEAIKREPKRWDAYLAIGIFNFYAANIPPGLQFIASLLGISGNEATGLKQLQNTANNPNLFQHHALFVLTHALGEQKKNYAGAAGTLNRLIQRFPNNPHFLLVKGEHGFRMKQYAASRSAYDQFFNQCQNRTCNQRSLFLANYLYAAGYVEGGNPLEAAAYVAKASKLDKGYYKNRTLRLHYYKGMVFRALGKDAEALKEFEKVRAKKDESKAAWELTKKELEKMGMK
ncbi:MAG: hypothetical protein Q7T11_03580 [Deltaproteobacteria bacterium]|nr:hypothetical protein [Deltaproteobacteria bacterium]